MRHSSRGTVVEAAVELASSAGMDAVTYEAVAEKTSRTRSGIVYHFPDRSSLVRAVCDALASRWDDEVAAHMTTDVASSTPRERALAYLKSAFDSSTVSLLSLLTDPAVRGLDPDPWAPVVRRWSSEGDASAAADGPLQVALAAADGIWARRALGEHLADTVRDEMVRVISALLADRVSE